MAPPRWLFRPVGETDKAVTTAEHGHVLANNGVWSPDSRWIVFDTRSDPGGDVFDSETIAVVNPHTRQVKQDLVRIGKRRQGWHGELEPSVAQTRDRGDAWAGTSNDNLDVRAAPKAGRAGGRL